MTTDNDRAVTSRRKFLTTATGGAGLAFLAGCTGSDGGSGGGSGEDSSGEGNGGVSGSGGDGNDGSATYTLGYSNFTNSVPFEVMVRKATEWYAADRDDVTLMSTAADGSTSQQISDCRNLLRQGVDGLIVTPTDSNGLARIAEEADVPVFSADIPINSEQVGMHAGVNQLDFGSKAGDRLVQTMNEAFGEDHQHRILEILMDQDNSNAVLRHRSFNDAIDSHDNAEVVKQIEIDGYSASDVASQATTYFQSDDEIHGVFAPWAGGPVGVLRALERNDMQAPRGSDGHVPIVSLDANAAIIDNLKQGFIDFVLDQPVQFYGPLSIHYMIEYLNNDRSADVLPTIGDEVTANDVTIEGGTHLGTDVWQEQLWSPAQVREFVSFNDENLGFPFLTTAIPVVDKEQADAPYLWGNLTRQL
jgi:ABC-type sugar transport system substrate-binding protein